MPFGNCKGIFKWKLSLTERRLSLRRPKLSAKHNPEALVVELSQSLLLPWPFIRCKAARSRAEKLQAACEGGVSLCVSIKCHTAKLSGGSVALGLICTPGANFTLHFGEHCFICCSIYHFWILKSNGNILELCGGRYFTSFIQIHVGFFFLHEKYWINLSC